MAFSMQWINNKTNLWQMNHLHVILSYKHEECWESTRQKLKITRLSASQLFRVFRPNIPRATETKDFVRAVLYCLV